jgi:hypothetical protein
MQLWQMDRRTYNLYRQTDRHTDMHTTLTDVQIDIFIHTYNIDRSSDRHIDIQTALTHKCTDGYMDMRTT